MQLLIIYFDPCGIIFSVTGLFFLLYVIYFLKEIIPL